MIGDLDGKVAFVTGAASGIGRALARVLAEARLKVMLADIEEGALDAALADLKASGAEARGVVCDVSDRASVLRAANETFAAFGNVHVVCNNAGVGVGGPIESIAPADWDWMIGVNPSSVVDVPGGTTICKYSVPGDANSADSVSFDGGPQVTTISLVPIFYGTAWFTSTPSNLDVMAAMQRVLQSPYLSQLDQYGFVSLNVKQSVVKADPNPGIARCRQCRRHRLGPH
jgi:NAD(P)-dependent dehydrogenase (short-subunit alcohol dehydrogenase family)